MRCKVVSVTTLGVLNVTADEDENATVVAVIATAVDVVAADVVTAADVDEARNAKGRGSCRKREHRKRKRMLNAIHVARRDIVQGNVTKSMTCPKANATLSSRSAPKTRGLRTTTLSVCNARNIVERRQVIHQRRIVSKVCT